MIDLTFPIIGTVENNEPINVSNSLDIVMNDYLNYAQCTLVHTVKLLSLIQSI